MKKFKINDNENSELNTKIKKSFERELEIMKKLKHSNLTRLIGYEQTIDKLNLIL
jgi:serine/threonine protein kinase